MNGDFRSSVNYKAARTSEQGLTRAEICIDNLFDEVCRVSRKTSESPQGAFTKKHHYTLIGYEGNAPNCSHSLIRSQSAHLHTGDLNQSIQRDLKKTVSTK